MQKFNFDLKKYPHDYLIIICMTSSKHMQFFSLIVIFA